MNKLQLITIDSSKGDTVYRYSDFLNVNLNSLIRKKYFDVNSIEPQIRYLIADSNDINVTNLASLCYKLGVIYTSEECLDLVYRIKQVINKINRYINFVECGVTYLGELDVMPFRNLVIRDRKNSIIYINRILKDKLKVLGFSECQLAEVVLDDRVLNAVMPKDLLSDLLFTEDEAIAAHRKIRNILFW